MRKITCILLSVLALMLSGCAYLTGPTMYQPVGQEAFQTSEQMAYIMAVRDQNIAKAQAFDAAISKSTEPTQVVALTAAMFGAPGQQIDKPRDFWDKFLPYWSTGLPVFAQLMMNHGNTASNGGIVASGDGASVVVSSDYLGQGASKTNYVAPVSTKTQTYNIQTSTDASTAGSSGSYSKDNPISTYTGDSALPSATASTTTP